MQHPIALPLIATQDCLIFSPSWTSNFLELLLCYMDLIFESNIGQSISHLEFVGGGAYGEVHKVSPTSSISFSF